MLLDVMFEAEVIGRHCMIDEPDYIHVRTDHQLSNTELPHNDLTKAVAQETIWAGLESLCSLYH